MSLIPIDRSEKYAKDPNPAMTKARIMEIIYAWAISLMRDQGRRIRSDERSHLEQEMQADFEKFCNSKEETEAFVQSILNEVYGPQK